MKFNVILNHNSQRTFKKATGPDGEDCILGTAKGADTDNSVSVICNEDTPVITYPSFEQGKLLYAVKVGNYIITRQKVNETMIVNCYKIISITDTEVIGAPC